MISQDISHISALILRLLKFVSLYFCCVESGLLIEACSDKNLFASMLCVNPPAQLQRQEAWMSRAYPSSEFVVANTLAKWEKSEPNEIDFSQGFSQKVVHCIKKLFAS